MLNTVKTMLGIADNSKDAILELIIDTVTEQVLQRCRIKTLPTILQNLVCEIVLDIYRSRDYGQEQADAAVSSIKEGEVSVSYEVEAKKSIQEIVSSYFPLLKSYARMGW